MSTELEGGGGGGGGGTGTTSTSTSCAIGSPLGVATDFLSAGQGQCARPSGELATVYVHGWRLSMQYNGAAFEKKGVGANVRYIAWESFNSSNTSRNQTAFTANLDTWCKGAYKPCEIVCHSHGCLAIGNLLANNPSRWNVLKVTAIEGAQGGTNLAVLANSIKWFLKAVIWACDKLHIKVPEAFRNFVYGSALNDMVPTAARGMYNHDTSTPWKTLSAKFKIPKKKCKWYQLGCHVVNFAIGAANGFLNNVHAGNHDIVVPQMSSASSRYATNSGAAPCNLTRWYGHSHITAYHGANGCSVGPNVPHSAVLLLGAADINGGMYTAPVDGTLGGDSADCDAAETVCNSENTTGTTTYYKPDGPYFMSVYGYSNLLDPTELNEYIAQGGCVENCFTTSTSSTGGGGGGGGGPLIMKDLY